MIQNRPTDTGVMTTAACFGRRRYDDLIAQMRSPLPEWLDERHTEYDILVALPLVQDLDWRTYFSLSEQEFAIECCLSEACAAPGMLGINRHRFVQAPIMQAVRESRGPLSRLIDEFDWTAEQKQTAETLLSSLDDIRDRTIGGAGVVAFHSRFRRDCTILRNTWASLPQPDRPSLPLDRPPQLALRVGGKQLSQNRKLSRFYHQFDEFCQRWRLQGLLTWDLPNVCGPNFSGIDPLNPSPPAGTVHFDIPPHFHLLQSDQLGKIVTQQHRRESEEMELTALGRWQEYAQLLRIHFLQIVAQSRYRNRSRPKNAITRLRSILAVWLGVDEDRVKKLQSRVQGLISGRLNSLGDVR